VLGPAAREDQKRASRHGEAFSLIFCRRPPPQYRALFRRRDRPRLSANEKGLEVLTHAKRFLIRGALHVRSFASHLARTSTRPLIDVPYRYLEEIAPVFRSGFGVGEPIDGRCFDSAERHDPYLEHARFHPRHRVLRCGRCFFIRHAAHKRVDCKKETVRAGANMGDVVAALPVACPIRHPCHCLGARKAFWRDI
jgi:hypothetical protein